MVHGGRPAVATPPPPRLSHAPTCSPKAGSYFWYLPEVMPSYLVSEHELEHVALHGLGEVGRSIRGLLDSLSERCLGTEGQCAGG